MGEEGLLSGKKVLVVDDDLDVLETIEELLSMCRVTKASTFDEAKELLENRDYDIAVLDIMGVRGYELLRICNRRGTIGVMLTANAMTPENVKKSFEEGAASFLPKEEMSRICLFLEDILEAREKGKSLWWRWYDRLADYFDSKFGPDWQEKHRIVIR
ncbi:MAG: response regulator [Deltaproteobacteria bacterium]|nr:response regulator [Deltaproteobacteria bacterium]MBW2138982.1 response regulator [Deltaproteobacteria bacterium]